MNTAAQTTSPELTECDACGAEAGEQCRPMCIGAAVKDEHDAEVAATIRRQLSRGILMRVGAHQFMRSGADLTFCAIILKSAKHSRGTKMRVTVHLNGRDLYDITVGYMAPRTLAWVTHAEVTDVDPEQMNRWVLALDCVI